MRWQTAAGWSLAAVAAEFAVVGGCYAAQCLKALRTSEPDDEDGGEDSGVIPFPV